MRSIGFTGAMAADQYAARSSSTGSAGAVPDVPSVDATQLGQIVAPDYAGACVANVIPALLEHRAIGEGWMPLRALDADQVVMVVIDGLGWHQLQARRSLAPVLASADGGPITTVAPSTTAAALTSITTGTAPGEHGIVGYRIRYGDDVLNALRWTTGRGDARTRIPPRDFQPVPAFGGRAPTVVNKADFIGSGFTTAHLDGVAYRPYATLATLVHEVASAVAAGERLVYTYYDGLDRVGHERGHGQVYDAELAFVDRLIGDIRAAVPDEVAVLVTADHGQVHTGDEMTPVTSDVLARCTAISGEDRFLWLHTSREVNGVLRDALAAHGDEAWVLAADEVLDAGLLGPRVTSEARERLGDVALLARHTSGFVDPDARNPRLLARHGSVTPAEMHVPLLVIEPQAV